MRWSSLLIYKYEVLTLLVVVLLFSADSGQEGVDGGLGQGSRTAHHGPDTPTATQANPKCAVKVQGGDDKAIGSRHAE